MLSIVWGTLLSCSLFAQQVTSPDGMLQVKLNSSDNGSLSYEVHYKNQEVLEKSPLGLNANIGNFSSELTFLTAETKSINETYSLSHAKTSRVNYKANELISTYLNSNKDTLKVVFKVANNDISLAYRISSPNKSRLTVFEEKTGFKFHPDTKTFITPQIQGSQGWMATKPSYEEEYTYEESVGTPSKYGLGYTFPGLFKLKNDFWVLLSETGVNSQYVGTRLGEATSEGLYSIAFPDESENAGIGSTFATTSLPFQSSWKTITVGDNLAPIVETTSAYDVVKSEYSPSQHYVPGRTTWSWILWQDGSCNYKDQQIFIDLAADLNFEYILIDALWDKQIGYEHMPSLIKYAQNKGVDVILWYNSNGAWNDAPQGPKNRMSTSPARQKEMEWMKTLGVKGIKVDFFGGDKQETMRLYEDILTDANRYGIFVNFHGTTLPRGWERMYPNHMTSEAALVSENLVFNQYDADQEAYRSTLYPFIRNAVSAMDFGPVFFNARFSKTNESGTIRKTTDAFQLATSVLYQSPIQHFGVTPNNLVEQPDYILNFMRTVPTIWDETQFIDGYPGKYCVIARRLADKWYVVAVNGTKEKMDISISFDELKGKTVSMIFDKKDRTAGYKEIKIKQKLTLTLEPEGGSVIYTQ